ncbi:MAG: ribonuclease Z, partial [Candidatus Shapirobacteria bacterium]
MKLTILGSGTSAMTKNRNPAGFVVESGGEIILLDAGFGVIRKLVDLGFDYQKIDLMGITHFHADHFGDAFNLIFARYVDDSYHQVLKPKGLNVMGPRGMEERLKKWREIYWPEESESYPVKFIEGESKLLVGEIMVETIKVIHVDHFESVAFRLTENGKTLVYTGDIGSRNRMDDLVKNFGQIDW